TRFGEITALDLSDTERRTFPMLSAALMLAATAQAEILDRPYVFAVMEPFLPRLLQRSRLLMRRMGQDVNHHGIRAVYFSHSHVFVEAMEHGDFRDLYGWIHTQVRSTLPG
ncbi:PEP-CTERM/exosortase system-associated acyltransferase, partial [bacterium]|nr:PEP-CTERM/exosortase system-associated acyltransferase [bacterium]